MVNKSSLLSIKAQRFSVAPMLDCTDSHFRVLMRLISRKAFLYTEMVVANALHHTNRRERLLNFNPIEHPLALQIGGDDPKLLSEAAQLGEAWGYDEINFNVGCPSQRVQAGNFGASLMANPDQVARCVEAMTKGSKIPVTVKHRIGIDNLDSDELLKRFVNKVASAGATRFVVHARKAWLKGLNPKQNRTIPPLQYDRVVKLKKQNPNLEIELNGGLDTPNDCLKALKIFDGAMVGRAAYAHPLLWKKIDEIIYKEPPRFINASGVIRALIPHTQSHLDKGGKLWDVARHILQLVEGVPGARTWRRELGIKGQKAKAEINILEEAAQQLEDAGL
ncbi:tRNA dihydrouridine(20/20a) synthase DusA [Prochlorococcus sp. MIT 1307]|uniref:tRNA dihydrouridine(20/20a) synthase DusA n=1 Tax=Prochlorococcus sp. MIT 1307 TaxID=3096219 RepID=UPI002A74B146|nr:tRNA dihydrouridine(20/20a) synthase DusA [Prochlorococcus sp. MIT 1307]